MASKRDATHLEEEVVIEGASYQYFQVDPCRAVIPGMPDGGWQPGVVVPHMRITRWRSGGIVRVYALCVKVRVPVRVRSKRPAAGMTDRGEQAEPGETEWRGAFEYYKTGAWTHFVANHPEWSDIGHCYFLILGGHYVPYNSWVSHGGALLRRPGPEEEEEQEQGDEEQGDEEQGAGRREGAPPCTSEQAAHNRACQGPEAGLAEGSGVYSNIQIDSKLAEFCAEYLLEHWLKSKKGELVLGGDIARGFNSYNQTVQTFNPAQQRLNTLVITSVLLDSARGFLPGFAQIERSVLCQLARRLKKRQSQLKLQYCHFLSQSNKTAGSSVFKWHRDDEVESGDSDDSGVPVYTVIVKLTADKRGSAPSQMMVAGAAFPFSYGAQAGSAGWFLSKLWHMSVMPVSEDTCLKIAFFFSEQD